MTPKQDTLSSIHFDTLWRDVKTVLTERSDTDWQHHGDSDAGIAMLQALAYGISDVSYRHTHDLSDILTLKKTDPKGLPFLDIRPEDALATAPVTADDYRQLIIDETAVSDDKWKLHSSIRNVAVRRHPDGDRLQVLLVPEWIMPEKDLEKRSKKSDTALAHQVELLLSRHRSLGARAPVVRVAGAQDIAVTLEVDLLSDDVDLAKTFAQLYALLDDWVSPRAKRVQGGRDGKGGDAASPDRKVAGDIVGALTPFPFWSKRRRFLKEPKDVVGGVKSVDGIRNIYEIRLADTPKEANEDEDFVLYKRDFSKESGREVCEWTAEGVRWCGIMIRTARAVVPNLNTAIINEIVTLRASPVRESRATAQTRAAAAKWRNLADRVETWKRLPPSFGLHEKSASDKASQTLWQFLSAYDDHLSALCSRLDNLKRHVLIGNSTVSAASNFSADGAPMLSSASWSEPREADLDRSVYERGVVQEHLLHYFGVNQSAATRTPLGFYPTETVARNDDFIANVIGVGRDRTIAKGTFSALQKEIAYSLGLYSPAFSREQMTPAPFYMLDISHLIPKAIFSGGFIQLTVIAEPDQQGRLKGTAPAGTALVLAPGAIVDVSQADASSVSFPGVVVEVDVGSEVDTVTVQLSGERDAWATSLASLRSGSSVRLRSHRSESAYFNLQEIRRHGDTWRADADLNGTFPWMKPNLPVKIHLLTDGLANARQEWESSGTIALVNDGGHCVVEFASPPKFTAESHGHRLFMTIPGLYETRSGVGRRIAFIFPQPRRIGHVAFKAWQRVVDQTLARQVPAHLDFEVYWLGDGAFATFEHRYLAWRTPEDGGAVSDEGKPGVEAIAVLETLGLARVIQPLKGIGTLHIKRDGEDATSADDALKHWIFHVKSSADAAALAVI